MSEQKQTEAAAIAAEEKKNEDLVFTEVTVPAELADGIQKKIAELKKAKGLKKLFVIVVEGDKDDEKPFYVAYFQRPNLMHFSQYMTFVQKDIVQANKMLAMNTFIGGDRELVDDDELFLYGSMQQLTKLIESRNADMLKK